MGCLLGVYDAYLGVNKYAPKWTIYSIGTVAVLLLVEALMSCCGVQHQSNICLSCATLFAVPLLLGEVGLSVAMHDAEPHILHYLKANQSELKLSLKEIGLLQRYTGVFLLLAGWPSNLLLRVFKQAQGAGVRFHRTSSHGSLPHLCIQPTSRYYIWL
jgi:hypothetical protein